MKTNWLDRRIAAPGPYLALVLSEDEYRAALKHCKVSGAGDWVKTQRADATTHFLLNDKGVTLCIVALRGWEGRNPIEVAGLLVHEAVHVWQEHCASIGETNPGQEQEAYGVQAVAQELMAEFARRVA